MEISFNAVNILAFAIRIIPNAASTAEIENLLAILFVIPASIADRSTG